MVRQSGTATASSETGSPASTASASRRVIKSAKGDLSTRPNCLARAGSGSGMEQRQRTATKRAGARAAQEARMHGSDRSSALARPQS